MAESVRFFTSRKIQIALGCLWLLDGALQLQRQMFTSRLANQVVAPAAQGQPTIVSGPMHFAIHTFLMHPAVFNSLIVIIQLGLGMLILWKRTAKFGLMASIFWGLFVWFIGEGLGGLLTGHVSLLMGAPGAALLYSLIALGVLPSKPGKSEHPAAWLAIVWAVIWLGAAILQLVAGQNTAADLANMIRGIADGAPGWLGSIDTHAANLIQHRGWIVFALVAAQALIGFGGLLKRARFPAIIAGIGLSIIFWIIGQSLGNYYTGLATDPNTAPLIILLGLAVLGAKELDLALT